MSLYCVTIRKHKQEKLSPEVPWKMYADAISETQASAIAVRALSLLVEHESDIDAIQDRIIDVEYLSTTVFRVEDVTSEHKLEVN